MSNTIKLTHREIKDIVDSDEPVSNGKWRWGTTSSYVIERNFKNYMFTVAFHVEEGLEDGGDIEAVEVEPIVIETTEWRKVK